MQRFGVFSISPESIWVKWSRSTSKWPLGFFDCSKKVIHEKRGAFMDELQKWAKRQSCSTAKIKMSLVLEIYNNKQRKRDKHWIRYAKSFKFVPCSPCSGEFCCFYIRLVHLGKVFFFPPPSSFYTRNYSISTRTFVSHERCFLLFFPLNYVQCETKPNPKQT